MLTVFALRLAQAQPRPGAPLDRTGMTQTWAFVFVAITLMAYLYIGWRPRVRESAGFYVAGRGVPAIANSAATSDDWMSAASFISMAGLISFPGAGGDGTIKLESQNGVMADATIDRDIIVLSTPEVSGLAPWVVAFIAAGGLAAILSTAAGLLLIISSSIAHDLFIHFVDPHASQRKR